MFDNPFILTNEKIDKLSPEAKIGLIKLGAEIIHPCMYIINDVEIAQFLQVFYKMDKPMTVHGIMRNRPAWIPIYDDDNNFIENGMSWEKKVLRNQCGRNYLTWHLIRLFLHTDLIVSVHDINTKYMNTPTLKEIIKFWLDDKIC